MNIYELESGETIAIDWSEIVLIQYIKGSEIIGNPSALTLDFRSKLNVTLHGNDADNVFKDFKKIVN